MSREPVDLATVAALIEDAAAAPSLHNAQPWAFSYARRTGVLHLYADLERALPHTDPDDRGLHIGCGAALFNLRAAAAGRDLTPTVQLLPATPSPNLLAEIVLQGTGPPDAELARLAPAIRRRHSSRHPFQDKELPPAATEALCTAARAEGCELLFPSAWHVQSILELVRDAEGRELIDPEVRGETVRWSRTEPYSGGGAVDGIPGEAFGPRRRGASVPVRDFAVGRPVPGRGSAVFEKSPNVALLGTAQDLPADWLRAGQALERVLLQATVAGLVASVTSQPLEWPETRWAVRDPVSSMAHVQMIIRLGYGPAGETSPRRPVTELLDVI